VISRFYVSKATSLIEAIITKEALSFIPLNNIFLFREIRLIWILWVLINVAINSNVPVNYGTSWKSTIPPDLNYREKKNLLV